MQHSNNNKDPSKKINTNIDGTGSFVYINELKRTPHTYLTVAFIYDLKKFCTFGFYYHRTDNLNLGSTNA